jgi:XTP/dITP diphosphohydrolase
MREYVLAVATGNQDKAREIRAVLGPLGVRVVTAAEAGAPAGFAPEETGSTFEENSRIKAEALVAALLGSTPGRRVKLNVDGIIADDSGLCVDALGGAPGVYSARFADMSSGAADGGAAGEGVDARNRARLLGLLGDAPYAERTARFVCVITLLPCGGGGPAIVRRGECEGHITVAPRGTSGFGYDPVFVPLTEEDGAARTFAEMPAEEKNAVSHRGRALAKLYEAVGSLS